jgi:hypothetical protein
MFGKSLIATGRRSSINGTTMKTENGINLKRSVVVRFNYGELINKRFEGLDDLCTCRFSLRVRFPPRMSLSSSLELMRTSDTRSFEP